MTWTILELHSETHSSEKRKTAITQTNPIRNIYDLKFVIIGLFSSIMHVIFMHAIELTYVKTE